MRADHEESTTSQTTQNNNTTLSFEEWTEKYFSSSKEAERTTTGFANAQKQSTTTTYTTQSNTSTNDTTKFSTTTSMARKTTRTATKEEKDMLYGLAYNQVMKEYYDYQLMMNKQSSQINDIEAEIDALQKQASTYYGEYQKELGILKNGMPIWGYLIQAPIKMPKIISSVNMNLTLNLSPSKLTN